MDEKLSSFAKAMRQVNWEEYHKPKHDGTPEGIVNQFYEDIQDNFT